MFKRLQIRFILFFLSISCMMHATHIVGGALTYVYNGGSSYTVTLKLYRDCGTGTAGFPGNVLITVLGNNGAPFSPSRDISMDLLTVTAVPSNLDPCATPPNPMPCTQQGIYSTTVNNLPPNPGGYHLFYQVVARNLSLSNVVNAACNCIGESFYADIPGTSTPWAEDFLLANGTTVDNGPTAWSIAAGTPAPTTASVQNNLFEITGSNNGAETWTSQSINISGYPAGVYMDVNLAETGTMDAADSILVYYRLNGGPLTLFSTNGAIADDFTAAIASQTTVIGNTLQVIIRVHYDAASPNSEIYRFDNIQIHANDFLSNSNPEFDLSPPLFLCAGKPFSFDHSAKDKDGDSLVYSFYTPYNGDSNAGVLDPTFVNNQATFQPIAWKAGYSATNPLGGAPLLLNASTGLLEGTPATLGQFVVGVMVKEYRNGVYMSQTLRDFQFNVVSCPEQISAILNPITSCNGTTINFSNLGGSTGNNWYWNFGDPAVTTDVSTLNFPSYTYPKAGTYTVTLITGYKTNCADTATALVNVVSIKAGFTHDAPKCVNNNVTFTQTSTSSSNDVIIASSWNFGDGTSSTLKNPVHAYAIGGTYKVLLTLTTNLSCTDTISKYITVQPKPIVNAGPDQTVCATIGTALLNGTITTATGGVWTTSGSGTFLPAATALNATYKASNADTVAGSFYLILTSTGNGVCSAVKDSMRVLISHTSASANAGPDKIICGVSSTTITGNTPATGTGKWTVVSGAATITDPNSANTTVTGLLPGNSYVLRWTVSTIACIPSSDDVTITVDLVPTPANAGTDQKICNTTTATLAANIPVVGTGLWSVVSGTAVITAPTSPTSTITGLVAGDTVVMKWTISKGLCNNSSTVKIIITKAAVVNAGIDQSFCTSSNVKLAGSVSGGTTTGVWGTLGDGTFAPSAAALTPVYIPGSNDAVAKKIVLFLTSTNNNVCSAATDTMNVFITGFVGTVSVTTTKISCYGNSDGTATATVSGGIAPYTYFWNTVPAQTTATATNLGIGTYSITIKNNNGCITQTTATITQPAPLAVNSAVSAISCYGGGDGMINITPTGGTPPYSYLSLPGNQTTVPVTGLATGTYTVTVTDSKNCKVSVVHSVSQPTEILTSFSIATVSCFNKSDGAINSTTTGGMPPYTYSWNPTAATSANVSGLAAGTYTVTVTDKLGCSMSSSTVITEPATLAATVTSSNETCNYLNNGSATAIVSGGTPAYSYTWLPGGAKTATIAPLTAATYTLTVKDLRGCNLTQLVKITEPATLVANTINQVNVSCSGGNNGSVTANPSGGTIPYSYLWMPGNVTTATLGNASAGTYTLTVTDKNNCTAQKIITITQPTALAATAVIGNVSCPSGNNGSVKIVPSGGYAPYTYLWLPVNKTTATISNLVAGTYTVTVTDAIGCKLTVAQTVTQPLPISITFAATGVSCFGGTDGTANAIVTGGTPPYSYKWSVGNGTTASIAGLGIGTYTVTVTDNAGCKAAASVAIKQPTLLTATITTINETCNYLNDGSVSASASGGIPPYKYAWQPMADTTTFADSLSAGTYTLTVTDSKGCMKTISATVQEPLPVSVAFNGQVDVSCFGGSNGAVTAVPSGGTPNYTYNWMPGNLSTDGLTNLPAGTYTVTIKDNNNCQAQNTVTINQPLLPVTVSATSLPTSCFSGSDGSASAVSTGGTAPYTFKWMPNNKTGETVSNLTAGSYTVTTKDANGCKSSTTVIVNQPPQINIITSSVDAACFLSNGMAKAAVSGGTAPYTYQWSPTGGTADSAIGLLSGPYTVVVTDMNGCKSSATVNVNDKGVPKPSIFSVVDVKCYGDSTGSASVMVSGGSGNYTYVWSPHGGNGTTAVHLTAGNYTVTVIDSAGCQSLATTSPAIKQPPKIIPEITTTEVKCFGGNDGSATAIASGGNPGYTYTWLPGGTSGSSIQNLSAGTYTLQVKDANNCIQQEAYKITQPTALYLTLSAKPLSCFGGKDGSIAALASGGTGPYNYKWMPGNISGQKLSNLPVGTYTVTTTDYHGCNLSSSIAVNQPSLLTLTSGSKNATCDLPTGIAFVKATGGSLPYTYEWVQVNTFADTAKNLYTGNYTVTVKDANQCKSSSSVFVGKETAPAVSIATTTNVSCNGGSNATATATITGGKAPFTQLWLPTGGTTTTATGLTAGSYTITVTDANGCEAKDTTSPDITEPPEFNLTTTVVPIKCFGENNGAATVLAAGGTPGYTYNWLPSGGNSATANQLAPGTYTVQVTDANSCKKTTEVVILQPDTLTATIHSTNVNCHGEATGSATVDVTGGTANYNYNWLPYGGNGPIASNLSPGAFSVSIIDKNGCTANSTVTIIQPLQMLSASAISSDVSCFGSSNGKATVSVSGGSPGYTYSWTPGGQTDSTVATLKAGNHYVQVKDANGCETIISITISQPTMLNGELTLTNPSCGFQNGSIVSSVSGGTLPYTYVWSDSTKNASLTSLNPGNYSLFVTDANGCTKKLSATLADLPAPVLSIASLQNISCYGKNDGQIVLATDKGTGPLMINWSPYGGNGLTASQLIAGSYTALVIDSLGCETSILATITEPAPVNLNVVSVKDVSCYNGNDGNASVLTSGGTPPYSYSWLPVGSTSPVNTNLTTGTYTVITTDQHNCSTSVSIFIDQPSQLTSAILEVKNNKCFDDSIGSISVNINGGVLPYVYSWYGKPTESSGTINNLPAGSYHLTVTDANGCETKRDTIITAPKKVITTTVLTDTVCPGMQATLKAIATGGNGNYYFTWSPVDSVNFGTLITTPSATITYTVTAYDINGCKGAPDTATVYTYSLDKGNVSLKGNTPICPGQSTLLSLSTKGITGTLSYLWNNNLGTTAGPFKVTLYQSLTYTVKVTNECGATVMDSVRIEINKQPVLVMGADTNAACVPAIIQFNDSSVAGNLDDPIISWKWNFGDGTGSELRNPVHTFSKAGQYPVTLSIRTGGGCINGNAGAPILVDVYPNPVADFSVNKTILDLPYDELKCFNTSTGSTAYKWELGDGATSSEKNPIHVYSHIGDFHIQLIATNQYGCLDTTARDVHTDADIIFPNVFTPTSAGSSGGSYDVKSLANDVFFPYTSGVVSYKLQIFNRWGELIFESFDVEKGWDGYYNGNLCEQGVYIWKAAVELSNGKTFNKTGDVTLLR